MLARDSASSRSAKGPDGGASFCQHGGTHARGEGLKTTTTRVEPKHACFVRVNGCETPGESVALVFPSAWLYAKRRLGSGWPKTSGSCAPWCASPDLFACGECGGGSAPVLASGRGWGSGTTAVSVGAAAVSGHAGGGWTRPRPEVQEGPAEAARVAHAVVTRRLARLDAPLALARVAERVREPLSRAQHAPGTGGRDAQGRTGRQAGPFFLLLSCRTTDKGCKPPGPPHRIACRKQFSCNCFRALSVLGTQECAPRPAPKARARALALRREQACRCLSPRGPGTHTSALICIQARCTCSELGGACR